MSEAEPTDEALFAAWVAGDATAFRALYERWAPRVARVVGRGVDPTTAGDLVQQTFLQLHRARADFREGSLLRPWLYVIAANVRRQHFRRRGRRPEELGLPEGAREPRVSAHDPVATDEARQVRAALEALPEGQRSVIELHWLEGLAFREIAEVVGASLSAVKVRAHRGYKALRVELEARGVTGPGQAG